MRRLVSVLMLLAVPVVACSTDGAGDSTSTSTPAGSTTSAPATTTTLGVTTTAPPTTTTAPDPPPDQVAGVIAGLSGSSEEIQIQWDAAVATDLDHYNIYFSIDPGALKSLLVAVPESDTSYIDYPRDLTEGINCYQVSAVDDGGNESALSDETCFSAG